MNWRCNGLTYHGKLSGSGDEVILFLHGFTGSHRSWEPFFPLLDKQYRLLAIDLIGHGETEAPDDPARYDIEKTASDLAELLQQLDAAKAHLVGYSMGGRVAITFASLYPDRVASLFLESTTPGLQTEQERADRRNSDALLAQKIEEEGLSAFIDYWENITLFASQQSLPNKVKRRLRKERMSHQPMGLANSLRGMGTGSMPSWWDRLHEFHMPMHLITGELDHKFCQIARRMKEQNPRFQHTVIPSAGHTVHLEQPQAFAHLLKQFFTNHSEGIKRDT